jgi:Resolvase, N terminal domain
VSPGGAKRLQGAHSCAESYRVKFGPWRLAHTCIFEIYQARTVYASRPKLAEALKACRVLGATLIIAKLDGLARNVHFISGLLESGVEFTAVDFPQSNRLTVHILAAVAEHEALGRAAAQRTAANSTHCMVLADGSSGHALRQPTTPSRAGGLTGRQRRL